MRLHTTFGSQRFGKFLPSIQSPYFPWIFWGGLMGVGLVLPFENARILSAFGIIFLLPGAWLTRSLRQDAVEALPLAFCASLAMFIPAAVIGFGAGLPSTSLKWLYLGTAIPASLLLRHRKSIKTGLSYGTVILFCLAALWAFLGLKLGAHQAPSSDSLTTLVHFRKLLEEPALAPISYYLDRLSPSARTYSYQIFYLSIFVATEIARTDVAAVWVALPALLSPLILMAFFTFVRTAFDDPKVGLTAAILFMWVNALYDTSWTRLSVFQSLIMTIPANLALSHLFNSLREESRSHLLLASALGALAVILYLGALFILVISMFFWWAFLFVISRDRSASKKVALFLLGIVVMSMPYLAIILPFYLADATTVSEVVAPLQAYQFVSLGGWRIVDPWLVYSYLGGIRGWMFWALASGLVALVPLWRYRKTYWGAYFLSAISITPLLQFNPLAVEAMLRIIYPGKILKFIPMIGVFAGLSVLALGIVVGFRFLSSYLQGPRWITPTIGALAFSFFVLIGWTHGNLAYNLSNSPASRGFLIDPPEIYREFRKYVPPGAVIASATLRIGAFANVYLPLVRGGPDEYRRIFDPDIMLDETESILQRYNIQYVLAFYPETILPAKLVRQSLGLEPIFVFKEAKFDRWPAKFDILLVLPQKTPWYSGRWVLYYYMREDFGRKRKSLPHR